MKLYLKEIFGTKLYHMGRELDPSFSKLSNVWGNSTLPTLGENIDRCITLHKTHFIHTLMNVRKMKFIS